MSEGVLVGFPTNERMKELEKVKDSIVTEFNGMTSQEISLLLKLVKDEVNTKLVFVI